MSALGLPPERWVASGLVLRSYYPGDGPLLLAATAASYEHLAPWMPWADPAPTLEGCERTVRRFRGRWLLEEDFTVAALDPLEESLLGGCGFHLRDGPREHGAAELGMWIRADAAGSGVGTRLLRALLAWGFAIPAEGGWGLTRLTWRCDARNQASRRVAEKAGLRLEGRLRRHQPGVDGALRDTLLFGLLREEWDPAES